MNETSVSVTFYFASRKSVAWRPIKSSVASQNYSTELIASFNSRFEDTSYFKEEFRRIIETINLHCRWRGGIGQIKSLSSNRFITFHNIERKLMRLYWKELIAARHLYMKLSLDHSLFWVFLYRLRRQFSISFLASHAATFFLFSIYILSSSFVASVRSRNLWRHVFVLDTRPLTSRQITVLPLLLRTKPFSTKSFLL